MPADARNSTSVRSTTRPLGLACASAPSIAVLELGRGQHVDDTGGGDDGDLVRPSAR